MKAWVVAVGLSLLTASVVAEPVAPVTPGSPSAAATPAPTAADAKPVKPPKPPKPPRPKLICEETKVLGSMMPTQVCATQAQWDARRRDDTAEVDRFHDRSGPIGGGGP